MTTGRRSLAGALVALGLLLGVGGLAYRNTLALIETRWWIAHTHDVLDTVDATVATLKDAEIAVRGYLATTEEELARRRELARPALGHQLEHLRGLVAGNSSQQRNLDALDAAIRAKLAYSDDVVDARRARDFGPTELNARLAEGLRRLDEIEGLAALVQHEERQLLALREAAVGTSTQHTLVALASGTILGVALLAAVLMLLNREVRQRTQQLEAANEALASFTYSVSHDLRAPLRAINGYAHILAEDHADALDTESRRVLDVICTNARQMGRLIDDLSSLSRLGRSERAP